MPPEMKGLSAEAECIEEIEGGELFGSRARVLTFEPIARVARRERKRRGEDSKNAVEGTAGRRLMLENLRSGEVVARRTPDSA